MSHKAKSSYVSFDPGASFLKLSPAALRRRKELMEEARLMERWAKDGFTSMPGRGSDGKWRDD